MMTKHPTSDLIASYAAGRVSNGVALAMASHLTYCAECRALVAAHERLAGAVMAAEGTDEPSETAPSFDVIRGLLDDEPAIPTATAAPRSSGPLPTPVLQAIGCSFEDIPWRFRLPGVAAYEFRSEDGEEVSLLKVKPGTRIPQHTHKAEELTVVFAGQLVDEDRVYMPGDMAIADASIHHHPQAGGDDVCICLAVVAGGLTFTGPIGRALNLFA